MLCLCWVHLVFVYMCVCVGCLCVYAHTWVWGQVRFGLFSFLRFIRRLHCLNARARPTTHAGNKGFVNGNGISFANSQKGSSISNSSSTSPHHFIHSSSFLSFAFARQLFVAHFFMVFTSSVALVPHWCLLTLTLTHTHTGIHTHTAAHAGKLGEFRFYPPRCTFNGVDMVLWPLWPLTHTPRKLHCLPFSSWGSELWAGREVFYYIYFMLFMILCFCFCFSPV